MSKFDEVLASYADDAKKHGISDSLLKGVAKGLGPSIYNADSSKVSGSDQAELDRVKANFLSKKLGITDDAAMTKAIAEVVEEMGSSNRNKQRVIFYAILAKKFGKESMFA
ncbi:MAG: DUF2853 family protein [Bacteroidota bacterium]